MSELSEKLCVVCQRRPKLIILGLPREQDKAQIVIRFLTDDHPGTILWERPGQPPTNAHAGLRGVQELPDVWTLNQSYVTDLEELLPNTRISVAPLVIPDGFFLPRRRSFTSDNNYAIYLGRFTAAKGAVTLAESWCRYIFERIKMPLLMVGLGLERGSQDELMIVAMAEKYPERLQLTTENGISARAGLLRMAQVAIFPAIYDHLPQSLIEAMAAGTPTICTSIPGYAPLARHHVTSLIVDTELVELADTASELVKDGKLRDLIVSNAQDTVRESYSEAAAGPVLDQLLSRLGVES